MINLKGRRDIPYCYVRLQNGSWLPLDRNYKPIGVSIRTWVNYEDFAHQAVRFDCDPHTLGDGVRETEDTVWLYSDDLRTHQTYHQRRANLESHVVG